MRKIITILLLLLFFNYASAQNQNVSNGIAFDGEPFMLVNPKNPNHIVVAWMGYSLGKPLGIKTKVSTNGGKTWSAANFLPHFATTYHSADPSMAFDTAGNIIACYIDYRESPDSGGIYVIKSVNGGLTWGNGHEALDGRVDTTKVPIDRPWFSINPVNNHFYITSKPAPWISAPNRPYFVTSSDGGLNWTAYRNIDTTGFLTGGLIAAPMAAPTTTSDGSFHGIYPSWVTSQNVLPGFIHAKSVNDGASFTYHPVGYSAYPASDTLAKAGYCLTADPNNPNHLVFTFLNKMNGDLDVFIVESTDGGDTWSGFARVNDDAVGNGKMQDLPWAHFSNNSDLIIGWRDRRNAPGTGYGQPTEIWGAVRWKDSSTFSPNFRISDTIVPYNATYLDQSGNDFMNIDMKNDTLYAVWGDVRTGQLNIWFAKNNLRSSLSTNVQLLATEDLPQISVYPNPANTFLNFRGETVKEASVYNSSGQLMFRKKLSAQTQQLPLQNLSAGVYIVEMETEKGEMSFKFTK